MTRGGAPSPGPMASALGMGAASLRGAIRFLTSESERVNPVARAARAALFVPLFSIWYACVKVHHALGGRLELAGRARSGATFTCRPPDLVQMYILLFGWWEPDLTAFIRRRLRDGDVFVDVGANVGYFSLEAARAVGDRGGVVAIEASPAIHAELERNVAADGAAGVVRTVAKAVAGERGTLAVYAGPSHNLGLTTTMAGRGFAREADVEAAPLADLLEPDETARARIVKIDVEGGEVDVLRGMTAFLERARDDVEIVVELSPQWWADVSTSPDDILADLAAMGFHAYEIDNDYWPWRYLWPRAVRPPRRLRRALDRRVRRLDLVLSRIDAEEL